MPKTIVVLNDRSLLSSLEKPLLLLGYNVRAASTVKETLGLVAQLQAPLLLANNSAFSSGEEALAALGSIREWFPGLRILLRVNQSSPGFQVEAQRAGIDRVLEATMPIAQLVTVITALLPRI